MAFCFLVVRAFIPTVLWGVIIAVGIFPIHQKLAVAFGQKEKLAAVVLTLGVLALLVVPTLLLIGSTVDGIEATTKGLKQGALTVPPPPGKIAAWPVIGKPLYNFWKLAAVNIGAALKKFEPFLKEYGLRVFSAGSELGFAARCSYDLGSL